MQIVTLKKTLNISSGAKCLASSILTPSLDGFYIYGIRAAFYPEDVADSASDSAPVSLFVDITGSVSGRVMRSGNCFNLNYQLQQPTIVQSSNPSNTGIDLLLSFDSALADDVEGTVEVTVLYDSDQNEWNNKDTLFYWSSFV